MARRTKEDAEKTRESLLDAAETVFLKQGVAATTLEDIAREAGVTRGAIYWHFDNKMAIFQAMYQRAKLPIDQMYERLYAGDDPIEGLKQLCIDVMRATDRDIHMRNAFTILRLRCEQLPCTNDSYAQEISKKRLETIGRFQKIFTIAAREKRLAQGITPVFAATALHSFISGIFWDYLRDPPQYPLSKYAPKLVDTFFRGLLKADAPSA